MLFNFQSQLFSLFHDCQFSNCPLPTTHPFFIHMSNRSFPPLFLLSSPSLPAWALKSSVIMFTYPFTTSSWLLCPHYNMLGMHTCIPEQQLSFLLQWKLKFFSFCCLCIVYPLFILVGALRLLLLLHFFCLPCHSTKFCFLYFTFYSFYFSVLFQSSLIYQSFFPHIYFFPLFFLVHFM